MVFWQDHLLSYQHILLAGSNWNNSSNARSQSQNANNYQWNANANLGGRFA